MASSRASTAAFPSIPVCRAAGAPRDLRGLLVVTAGDRVGRVIAFARQGHSLELGRGPECAVQFESTSISRVHARAVTIGDKYVVSDAGSTNGTFVNDRRINHATALDNGDRLRLGPEVTMRFSIVDAEEQLGIVLKAEGNDRDPLTGIYGRSYLEERLDEELASARGKGSPLSVMMIDVDHLAGVNDSHGRLAGDEVLAGVARVLRASVRGTDVLARYGGGKFALIAPNTPLDDAHCLAERLRCAVGTSSLVWRSGVLRVTISIGVASLGCCVGEPDRLSLLFLAGQRAYLARRIRNTVVSRGGCATVLSPSCNDDDATVARSG